MSQLNAFDAAPGRTVEVIHGDLFRTTIKVDLLVISARQDFYEPEDGSMVAVLLKNCGIKVGELKRELDFSQAPTILSWITPPLKKLPEPPQWPEGSSTHFRRLAVVESPSGLSPETTAKRVMQQMFRLLALLPMHGIECTSVAMPLLNTGRQAAEPQALYPPLIKIMGSGFRHVPDLRRLVIFDLKREPLDQLCQKIDEQLGRTALQREQLRSNKKNKAQLEQLLQTLENLQERCPDEINHPDVQGNFKVIVQELGNERVTLVTLAITARKLLEVLVARRLRGRGSSMSLFAQIKFLSRDISAWSISAMHTVRTFGNWMGHASKDVESDAIPQREVEAGDMLLMLHALEWLLRDYPWPNRAQAMRYQKVPQRKSTAALP